MSMIKQMQQINDDKEQLRQVNEGGNFGRYGDTEHRNINAGGLVEQLNKFATDVDELHTRFKQILKANKNEYDQALDYGVPNMESQFQKSVWALERTLQEMAGEIEHVDSTKFGE